ncbi:MAG: ribosome maturation factor RimP [Ruminococcus sp.]|nr:ribosome maturation factor RimP [Ruminococcus sp.]
MKLKKFGATEQRIYDLVKPITDDLGYYLWDVCYVKEGASWYLRIFIDCDEGITIEDCEKVTEPVNKLLDEVDPIKESYMLEIGSAGLERELVKDDHFEVCEGDKVRIRFIRAVDGEKEICAYLKNADKTDITVELENGTEVKYPFADIAFVKLWFDFD